MQNMKLITILMILIFGTYGPIFVHNQVPGAINNAVVKTKISQESVSVAGWFPNWDKERAMKTYSKNIRYIDEVSPYWFLLRSNGSVARIDNDKRIIELARKHNVKMIPMISNKFDGKKVSKIINDRKLRRKHIKILVNIVLKSHYDGIDIDYEGLIPSDRHAFSIFVKELSHEMHRRGKILSLALMSKTKEPGTNSTSKAQDWKALGRYADRLRIMAYDYHWKTSGPGPIAPYSWVKKIVSLAIKEIPPKKVFLGIGTYGYRWVGGKTAAVDFQNVPRRSFRRDRSSKELHTRDRRTWLQDSGSLKHKLRLVKAYKIRGIAFWRLGGEDPRTWEVVKAARG